MHYSLSLTNKDVDEVPTVEWLGTSELKADELLAETGGQVKAAKEFLLDFLAEGPKGSSEVEESAKASDIALSTLKRARKILRAEKRIRSTKDGPGGTWMIRLLDAPGAGQAASRSLDTDGSLETLDPDEPLTSHQHMEPPFPVSQEVQESQEVQGDEQSQLDTVAS